MALPPRDQGQCARRCADDGEGGLEPRRLRFRQGRGEESRERGRGEEVAYCRQRRRSAFAIMAAITQPSTAKHPKATRPMLSLDPGPAKNRPSKPMAKYRVPGPNATHVKSRASEQVIPNAIMSFSARATRGAEGGNVPSLSFVLPQNPRAMTINPALTNMRPMSHPIQDGAESADSCGLGGRPPSIMRSGTAPHTTVRMPTTIIVLLDAAFSFIARMRSSLPRPKCAAIS